MKMTVEPIKWTPFHEARRHMPTISSGWAYVSKDADTAMVNLLRHKKIEYHIDEARDLIHEDKPVDPAIVVNGLLSLDGWRDDIFPYEVVQNALTSDPDNFHLYGVVGELQLRLIRLRWESEHKSNNAVIAVYESIEQRVLTLGGGIKLPLGGHYETRKEVVKRAALLINPKLDEEGFWNALQRYECGNSAYPKAIKEHLISPVEGEPPVPQLRPGKELTKRLEDWAEENWGPDYGKLPDRLKLLALARDEVSAYMNRGDIAALRAKYAPEKVKKGGAPMHRK